MNKPGIALLLLLPLAGLAACANRDIYGSAPARLPASAVPAATETLTPGFSVARLALDMIGTPYRYGGADPKQGFDCSGLVFYTFGQSGLSVPRNSLAQYKAAKKISLNQAGRGDLVFFQDQEKLSHVGIYLGDGRFVHAPASGRTVSVGSLAAPYYQQHLVGVGRLLPD
jgi:cell wall-associated NlpC family hydrolase